MEAGCEWGWAGRVGGLIQDGVFPLARAPGPLQDFQRCRKQLALGLGE